MWADVNTKPVQGELFRIVCHHIMGVPVDYDGDVERRRTHLMLLSKVETERMTVSDEEMLKEIAVLAPAPKIKKSSSKAIKGIIRGKNSKLILLRSKLRQNEGVCWQESKYGSVSATQWKWDSGGAHFHHVYKGLE